MIEAAETYCKVFGWTYGSEEKNVNAGIAERIRKQILQETQAVKMKRSNER